MPLMPEGKNLYVSTPLTTISTAYAQTQPWIAPQVFPVVPVARQGDLYWKYPQGDWKRIIAGLRAPATETPGGGWGMEQDKYYCDVYGVHKDIDDQTSTNAVGGGFNLYSEAVNWVTQQLFLKRDRLWVDTYMRTGVWGEDHTGGDGTGGTTTQFDRTGADPIKLFEDLQLSAIERINSRYNVAVMGPKVFSALRNSQAVIERIKYSQPGFLTEQLIASVLGVDRIVVTWTTENIAPKGAADSIQLMNSKSMLLCYAAPTPGLQTLSAGYVFSWDGLLGAGAWGTRIKRFRMENIASDRIEGEMAFDMKVVAPDAGVFFSNIVQ